VSFDNALLDTTHNVELRQREFAWLTISGRCAGAAKQSSPVLAQARKSKNLRAVFFSISGELWTHLAIFISWMRTANHLPLVCCLPAAR